MSLNTAIMAARGLAEKKKRDELYKNSPYFPKYAIFKIQTHLHYDLLILTTKVRKQHEGKWYIIHVADEVAIETGAEDLPLMQRFIENVYHQLILGVHNEHFWKLDSDQTDEGARLTESILGHGFIK
jgi:hypothetical protein